MGLLSLYVFHEISSRVEIYNLLICSRPNNMIFFATVSISPKTCDFVNQIIFTLWLNIFCGTNLLHVLQEQKTTFEIYVASSLYPFHNSGVPSKLLVSTTLFHYPGVPRKLEDGAAKRNPAFDKLSRRSNPW